MARGWRYTKPSLSNSRCPSLVLRACMYAPCIHTFHLLMRSQRVSVSSYPSVLSGIVFLSLFFFLCFTFFVFLHFFFRFDFVF